jgi:uncharacterized protein
VERLAGFIVKKRIYFLVCFLAFSVISLLLLPLVQVNYDFAKYLPAEMATKRSLTVMEQEFGRTGSARAMIADVEIPEAKTYKSQIEAVDGVKAVVWLDDVVDIKTPLTFHDQKLVSDYYQQNRALYQITFVKDDFSLQTGEALKEIRALAPEKISITGPAMNTLATRETTTSQIFKITLFVIPIVLLILLVSTNSWFEPILFITVIGVSVLINMGTNVLVGEISFITLSSAALLQLAIAMDYSIFLLHRFGEERNRGAGVLPAMTIAVRKSFLAILASSLTTIAGFIALIFMQYQIGFDMGLVMAKGIILSLLAVMLLLPALTVISERMIERTRHRPLMPSLNGLAKSVIRLRFVIPVLAMLVVVPSYLAQGSNHFLYGDSAMAAGEGTLAAQETRQIEETFGRYNALVLLVPRGNVANEIELTTALTAMPRITSVQALVTLADPAIPHQVLPENLRENFLSENYSRLLAVLNTETESEEAFTTVDKIKEAAHSLYDDQYVMLGSSASVSDIQTVAESDFITVSLISIIAVATILLITFRSIIIPVMLVFAIQASIWMNMAVPYFSGEPLVYIGYLIVGAVQLGATIDYAILITSRYMEYRRTVGIREAIVKALTAAGHSIMTSAGFCVWQGSCWGLSQMSQ